MIDEGYELRQKVLVVLHAIGAGTIHSIAHHAVLKGSDGRKVRQALDHLEREGWVEYLGGAGNNRRYRTARD